MFPDLNTPESGGRIRLSLPHLKRLWHVVLALVVSKEGLWRRPHQASEALLYRPFWPFILSPLFQFCQKHGGFQVMVHCHDIWKQSRSVWEPVLRSNTVGDSASAANWRLLPGSGVECWGVQEPLETPVSSLPPDIRPDLLVLTPQALHGVRAQDMLFSGFCAPGGSGNTLKFTRDVCWN